MERKTVVVGGTNTDLCGESFLPIVASDSNIGRVTFSAGGVGHNIALNLALLGEKVSFITALGSDVFGEALKRELSLTLDISSSLYTPERSDIYLYVASPDGDMYVAVNDMENIKRLRPEFINEKKSLIEEASSVIVEANLNSDTIAEVCRLSRGLVLADAVSTLKEERLVPSFGHIDVFKPNLLELEYLYKKKIETPGDMVAAAYFLLDYGLGSVLLTLGKRGSVYISRKKIIYCPAGNGRCVNTTGAGDSFLAGFAFGMMEWGDEETAIKAATSASEITVQSEETVSPEMKKETLYKLIKEKETYEQIPGLF